MILNNNAKEIAIEVGREYVTTVKRWKDNEFDIQMVEERPGNIVVVDAVHADDLLAKGSNKSIQLHINVVRRSVIKELAYQ